MFGLGCFEIGFFTTAQLHLVIGDNYKRICFPCFQKARGPLIGNSNDWWEANPRDEKLN